MGWTLWAVVCLGSFLLLASISGITYKFLYNAPNVRSHHVRRFRPRNVIARGWCAQSVPKNNCEQRYLDFDTEYIAAPEDMQHMVDGDIVWIRMGAPNVLQTFGIRLPRPCDLDLFVKHILPKRSRPFVLITTDGDRSVPSELNSSTVQRLLTHKLLTGWYTQNYDGTTQKIKPIPIGLCLHVGGGDGVDPQVEFDAIRYEFANNRSERVIRIWSDCHFASYPRRHNNPRLTLSRQLKSFKFMDAPEQRVSQTEVWKRYTQYGFVVSLPGNGIDCYRTWEALYLGAIVITVPSPISNLYRGHRVEEIPMDEWSVKLNDENWLSETFRRHMKHTPVFNDTPEQWLRHVKQHEDTPIAQFGRATIL